MITTLTGENSFGWQRVLRQLMAEFVAEHGGLALERIDGEEADFARLQEAVNSLPFLSAKKMVVLRAPSKNKEFTEQAEQILANVPDTTEVIIVEPKLDKRLSYYKYLKSKTDFNEFNELDQSGLTSWLIGRAKEQGSTLGSSEARYLVERIGLNQQLLGNELDKLLLYSPAITRKTIDLLTDETPQSTIFQLLEAAFDGQSRRLLKLYKEQRALKVEPPQIIAMLAWQLHVMAIIKTAGQSSIEDIAKDAKLNPYVLRKSQSITLHLSLPDLKKLISDLLAIDTQSKRSAIDIDEALQHYLLGLAIIHQSV